MILHAGMVVFAVVHGLQMSAALSPLASRAIHGENLARRSSEQNFGKKLSEDR